MRKKQNKIIIAFILLVVCVVTYQLFAQTAVVNAGIFKRIPNLRGYTAVIENSNQDSVTEFNKRKKKLQEQKIYELTKMLLDNRESFMETIMDLMGEDFLALKNERLEIQNKLKDIRREFIASDEYKKVEKNMRDSRKKFHDDKNQADAYEEAKEQLKQSLASMTTMNITLRNKQKQLNEDLLNNTKAIREMIKNQQLNIKELQEQVKYQAKKALNEIIAEYNNELVKLKQEFDIEIEKDHLEMPFDEGDVKITIPINVMDEDFELEESQENLEQRQGMSMINSGADFRVKN